VANFSEIEEQFNQIKDKPEVMDELRTTDAMKPTGRAADDTQLRQEVLPDDETHFRLQEKYSKMFDKSSRAGAKSTLNGLILPGGRKNFSDFHDNFTGTGRFTPQKTPSKVEFSDKAPKVDPYPDKVVLYERCPQCKERIDQQNFIPQMTFIPPADLLPPKERQKWESVQVKPCSVLCYLFCVKCPTESAAEVKKIRHDPFKSALIVKMGEDGKPITLADIQSREYMAKVSEEISEMVFAMIKNERNNPDSQAFYGANKLT
jgi:hypothetical protein